MSGRVPLSAEASARDLAPLVHVLAALSRRSAGWLAHEPRLDRKTALAAHLSDDASSARALGARVAALREDLPGGPGPAGSSLLDRLDACGDAAEHLELVYGEIKPMLAAAAADRLRRTDPLAEQPGFAVLLRLRADQERHVAELPARDERPLPPAEHLDAEPGGEPRAPAPVPVAEPPARDPFLTILSERPPIDDPADALHALLHACLAAGERAAREHHDGGAVESALRCATHLRHVAVVDRLLAGSGSSWGDRPVGPPHADPFTLAEVVRLQHPDTDATLGHLLADR